jgi:AhpD family alkylhydroperoxidase
MSELLRKRFPWIDWAKPVDVWVAGKNRYGCRYCIAVHGLDARDFDKLYATSEDARAHIEKEHP